MNKEERFIYVSKELQKLYPKTPIPLDHDSIYTLLVAVLLSAQCTDIRVNQVTPALFSQAIGKSSYMILKNDQKTHQSKTAIQIVGQKTQRVI